MTTIKQTLIKLLEAVLYCLFSHLILFTFLVEAFYSAYKKWRHTGLPLVNYNVYWSAIEN